MKLKHTPVPWKNDKHLIIKNGSDFPGGCNIKEIAEIRALGNTLQEIEANTKLICVAPEMLEALIEYLDWGAKTGSDMYYFETKMKDLIEKATGQKIEDILK